MKAISSTILFSGIVLWLIGIIILSLTPTEYHFFDNYTLNDVLVNHFLIVLFAVLIAPIFEEDMKKLLFTIIVFALMLGSCYVPYRKMDVDEQNEIKKHIGKFLLSNMNDEVNALYSIKGENIDEVVQQLKDDERLLLVFFSTSCPYFNERKEKIRDIVPKYPNTKCLYITAYDWAFYGRYNSYWNEYLNSDIYMIDVEKYGSTKNPHKRQEPFVEEICPECLEKTGFPTLIVFNNKRELLFNPSTIDSLEFVQLEESLKP